jgi:predicted ATPase
MHRLAPDFIIEQYKNGEKHGKFTGAVLFVDISGFSTTTDQLMQHGQHGAEVLAAVMRAVFDPLVHTIYAFGGFIANFAGDAFTAIFRGEGDGAQNGPGHPAAAFAVAATAVAAGRQIQQLAQANADQETAYGVFTFSTKVGLATGEIEWGILRAENEKRAYYYFKGAAVDNCAKAEHHADQGDFILDEATYRLVRERVMVAERNGFYRVITLRELPAEAQPVRLPPVDVELMSRFFPRDLLLQELSGEFRPILYLFVGLQGAPTEEELAGFMQLVFRLQDRYGGFLNNLDFGDKGCYLYFFWGAPTRYDNDVSRILNFALDLKAGAGRPLRMGITYHIAHAGFVGSDLQEEYTCYGRGVNLAARFMTSAGWQEIWIDEQVENRASAFVTDIVGERQFKGFAQAQTVYALLGREQFTDTPAFSGRLVGRQAEWQQLNAALQPLSAGHFAGYVTVVGEAGIGKSRLVHEFLENSHILDFGARYLCQTDEILRQSLNPFRYWLREYFQQIVDHHEAGNKAIFDRILDGLIADTEEPPLRRSLKRGRSFLAALVDLYWPHSLYAESAPRLRFENTIDALKALIKAESRRQPVLLVIEDVHWLDGDSRRFLHRLRRNVAGYPFAVLMTSREALRAEQWEMDASWKFVYLESLPKTAIADMVTTAIGQELEGGLLTFLHQRTEGNPFFVEQLLYYLRDQNMLGKEMDRETLRAVEQIIPTDIQAVMVARLDRLPGVTKDVVQTAAVLGREFIRPIVTHMRPETEPELQTIFGLVEQQGIWQWLDERRLLFRHALMRDAAYNMQLQARLQGVHKRAAEAFETIYQADLAPNYDQIAYHYDQARVVIKALDYYERAADQAREKYQNEAALAHYRRALALVEKHQLATRFRLHAGREAVLGWLGQREAQQAELESMEELADRLGDQGKQAETSLRRTALALATGEYDAAVEFARKSVQYAQAAQDPLSTARSFHRLSRAFWQKGQHEQARPYLEKAIPLAEAHNGFAEEASCLYDLSILDYYQQRFKDAHRHLEQGLRIYQRIGDKRGEIECLSMSGILHNAAGEYIAAQAVYEQALSLTRSVGYSYGESRILGLLGNGYFYRGDYEGSIHYHEQGLQIYRELNDREGEAIGLDTLGLTYYCLDDYERAKAYLLQATKISRELKADQTLGFALTHLGFTLTRLQEYTQATAILEEALRIRQVMGLSAFAIDTQCGLAQVYWETGRKTEALALVDDIRAWIEANGPSGIELPVQVYLVCYQILAAAQKDDPRRQQEAQAVLAAGKDLLAHRSAQIQDDSLRQQFLQNVPFNRQLWAIEP